MRHGLVVDLGVLEEAFALDQDELASSELGQDEFVAWELGQDAFVVAWVLAALVLAAAALVLAAAALELAAAALEFVVAALEFVVAALVFAAAAKVLVVWVLAVVSEFAALELVAVSVPSKNKYYNRVKL